VVSAIKNQIKPEFMKTAWEPRFPGQPPSQLVAPEALEGDTFHLEGEELKVVPLGHTDTSDSTALYVPPIGLIVSGDGVYNNTHLYLAETNKETRNAWLRALDKIESLHLKAVVAGHGVLDPDSSPRPIEETRRYLREFNASVASTSTAMELYKTMLSLYPDRVNPGSLWAAAKTSTPLQARRTISSMKTRKHSVIAVLTIAIGGPIAIFPKDHKHAVINDVNGVATNDSSTALHRPIIRASRTGFPRTRS
jgi:glyoxylase-like metal-dependent hydrolase (beta-lactamase superfamily II)